MNSSVPTEYSDLYRPQILFISEYEPSTLNGAGRRARQTLSALSTIGNVHIALLPRESWGKPRLQPETQLFPTTASRGLKSILSWLFGTTPMGYRLKIGASEQAFTKLTYETAWDLIWIYRIRPCSLLEKRLNSPLIIDFDDLQHNLSLSINKERSWPRVWFSKLEARRWKKLQCSLASQASACILANAADSAEMGDKNFSAIENSYPLSDQVWQGTADRPYMLFVGDYSYMPNRHAALFLAQNLLPLIRQNLPDFELLLIGQTHPDLDTVLEQKGVQIIGRAPELMPYYQNCCCAMSTLFMGSGSSMKVAEALSLGVPLVANQFGVRGFALEHGQHALIAEDPQDIAEHVIQLHRQPEYAKMLAGRGREFFQQNYAYQQIENKIINMAQRAMRSEPA